MPNPQPSPGISLGTFTLDKSGKVANRTPASPEAIAAVQHRIDHDPAAKSAWIALFRALIRRRRAQLAQEVANG